MSEPSKKAIALEIKKLEALRPLIPQFSAFGDSNRDKVDVEIQVLRENLAEWEVNDLHDEAVESENPDDPFFNEDNYSAARYAADWLAGDAEDGPPSEGWQELVGKAQVPILDPRTALADLEKETPPVVEPAPVEPPKCDKPGCRVVHKKPAKSKKAK